MSRYRLVLPATQGGWYVDAPLNPTNLTTLVFSAEHGAVSLTNSVEWLPFSLFAEQADAAPVLLRTDDSLLLDLFPAGASSNAYADLSVVLGGNVVTSAFIEAGAALPFCFEASGLYELQVTAVDGDDFTNASARVAAVSARFAGDPSCLVGKTRAWACPAMPLGTRVETDPGIVLRNESDGSGGSLFSLRCYNETPSIVIARLVEGGPVLDHAVVRPLEIGRLEDTLDVVQVLADGTQLIRVTLHAGDLPDDIGVTVKIFVGGVTFDDGTIQKTLTADDFNELGETTFYMLRGPRVNTSVCHYVEIYQDGVYLGRP